MSVALKSLFGPGSAFSLRIGVAALALLVFSGIIGSSDAKAQDLGAVVEVEVEAVPLKPLVRPVRHGESVTLNGSTSTGDILSYDWEQVTDATGGTAVAMDAALDLTIVTTITPATGTMPRIVIATATFTAPSNDGKIFFKLTVDNEDDDSIVPHSVTVTIIVDGTLPTAAAGADDDVNIGESVTLGGSGTDDSAPVSYLWTIEGDGRGGGRSRVRRP